MGNEEYVQEILEEIIKANESDEWDYINSSSSEKKLDWYEENKDDLDLQGTDVRKAYTLIMIEYFGRCYGVTPDEVPVVYEDERKIVWRSYNYCPVLEACKKGELDTREVCKKGWEQSVQDLIEKVNPKLHFSRNYKTLRPHGKYCEESIELIN